MFLDFDGVLSTHDWMSRRAAVCARGGSISEFMPEAVKELNRILTTCDVGIVVSSSWRVDENLDWTELLEANGVAEARKRFLGQTPDLSRREGVLWEGATRGEEIAAWVKTNGYGGRFASLDDDPTAGAAGGAHFQTGPETGLTAEIADQVIVFFRGDGGRGRESGADAVRGEFGEK